MSEIQLPPPREALFGCLWLPRLRAKARLAQRGELPEVYQRPFCAPQAVDGQFLTHFQTDKTALLESCDLPDDAFNAWFLALPGNGEAHIAAWNEIAVNLGRPGYPMAERFAWAKSQYYTHLNHLPLNTVFEALEADEGITQG